MNNKKLMKVLGLLAVVALVAALLPVSPVKAAATICVGPTTEGCKPTITEAVSAASAGDTIYIKAGTYNENISTSKQLNIIGEVDEAGEPLVEIGGRLNFDLPSAPFAWRIENINFVVGTTYDFILRLKNANGLTIKNSTFDGAGNYHAYPRKTGIELRSGTNNVTIENSLFTHGLLMQSAAK